MQPRSGGASGPSPLARSYDSVAEQYAERFFDELQHKPLDRALLGWFADEVRGRGEVLDLGCGPGQIARHLHGLGVAVTGWDLSARMVQLAARRTPAVQFRQGSMLELPIADGSIAGAVALYAIVHFQIEQVRAAARELCRVLAPGAPMLLSFHVGTETVHLDSWWEQEVDLDFHFFEVAAVESALTSAGLAVEARIEREPHTAVEHPSRRAYLFARKPR